MCLGTDNPSALWITRRPWSWWAARRVVSRWLLIKVRIESVAVAFPITSPSVGLGDEEGDDAAASNESGSVTRGEILSSAGTGCAART